MRWKTWMGAVLVIAAVAGTAPTARAKEGDVLRSELTTREAAWLLGVRFGSVGFLRLRTNAVAEADAVYSLSSLVGHTDVGVRVYPTRAGDVNRDAVRLATFIRTERPRIAKALNKKYDASHGALFRLGVGAGLLMHGYRPGGPVTRETLSDLRAAIPVARIPGRLIEPVRRNMHAMKPRAIVIAAVAEFANEVRHVLRQEDGDLLPGVLWSEKPPEQLHIWLLASYAAHAQTLHVHGKLAGAPEVTQKLERLAKLTDVSPPSFPSRNPSDLAGTAQRSRAYLMGTWAPQITDKWEYRYSGVHGPLFVVPLVAVSMLLSYTPGSAEAKKKSAWLKRHARYAGLPHELIDPLTDLLDAGAPRDAVAAATETLLRDVDVHLRRDEPDGAPTPNDLAGALMASASNNDIERFVALFDPEQRGVLSLLFAVLPVSLLIGISEHMDEMLGLMMSPEERDEATKKTEAKKAERDALWRKYGVKPGTKVEAGSFSRDPEHEKRLLQAAKDLPDDIDHAAFIRDARAFMKKHGTGDAKSEIVPSKFITKLTDIAVSGDTATAKIDDSDRTLRMVERGGRWYADAMSLR